LWELSFPDETMSETPNSMKKSMKKEWAKKCKDNNTIIRDNDTGSEGIIIEIQDELIIIQSGLMSIQSDIWSITEVN